MRKILAIMWKDVNVLFRDGAAVALIIAAPLVLAVGMGLITGSFYDDAPVVSQIPVIVVDHDGGRLAQAFIDLLGGDELGGLLVAELTGDETAALDRARKGDVTAAIIIPPGFSDSLMPDMTTGQQPAAVPLAVYGDPGSPIRAQVARDVAEEFVARAQTGMAAVRLGLTELATSGAVPPAELPALGQAMGEQIFRDAAGPAADSPVALRVESAAAGAQHEFNPLSFFAPAMALLFLMYAVTLGARTLLSERREGTLARMLAAPITPAQLLGGKIAGIFLGGFIQLTTLIVLTTLLFRLNWGSPLGVALLVVAATLAATGWGLLLAAISTNPAQVSNLGIAMTLIFGILGGSFIPGQNPGPLLNALGRITPNRWALDGFVALAAGEGTRPALAASGALLVMAAVLFVVAAVVFRRRQAALLIG